MPATPITGARTLPCRRACGTSTEVRFDYYRDANAAFEAFKSGLADVRIEGDPVRWNTVMIFPP
jgi:peptide/nickel transport system substrate-binding protein